MSTIDNQNTKIEELLINSDDNLIINKYGDKTFIITKCFEIMLKCWSDNNKYFLVESLKKEANINYDKLDKCFGSDVGIITGDDYHNVERSKILVVTIDVFKSIIQREKIYDCDMEKFTPVHSGDIKFVIFNNFQYFFDMKRGYLWEDSIVQCSDQTRIVTLSSDITKTEYLKEWFNLILKRKTTLVETLIPISIHKHMILQVMISKYEEVLRRDKSLVSLYMNKKLVTINKISGMVDTDELVDCLVSANHIGPNLLRGKGLINYSVNSLYVNNYIPAIYFVFNIEKCEKYALMSSVNRKELLQYETVKNIVEKIMANFSHVDDGSFDQFTEGTTLKNIISCATKRISWYHSGMMPIFKYVVEQLYIGEYLDIIFSTEFFPYQTKIVVFTSLFKTCSDGNYNLLDPFTFSQMVNKSGRPNVDDWCYVLYLPSMYNNPNINNFSNIDQQIDIFKKLIENTCYNYSRYYMPSLRDVLQSCDPGNITENEQGGFSMIKKRCKKSYAFRKIDFNYKVDEDVSKFLEIHKLWERDPLRFCTANTDINNCDKLWYMEKSANDFFIKKVNYYLDTTYKVCKIKNNVLKNYNTLLNFLRELNFVDDNRKITKLGLSCEHFSDGVDFLPLLLLINDGHLLHVSNDDVAGIVSLFIQTEFRTFHQHNTDLPADNYVDFNRKIIDNVLLSEKIEKFIEISERYRLPVHIFKNSPFGHIVYQWINEPNKSNFMETCKNYRAHPGIVLKSLIKIKNLLRECSNVSKFLGNDDLSAKFNAICFSMGKLERYNNALKN